MCLRSESVFGAAVDLPSDPLGHTRRDLSCHPYPVPVPSSLPVWDTPCGVRWYVGPYP